MPHLKATKDLLHKIIVFDHARQKFDRKYVVFRVDHDGSSITVHPYDNDDVNTEIYVNVVLTDFSSEKIENVDQEEWYVTEEDVSNLYIDNAENIVVIGNFDPDKVKPQIKKDKKFVIDDMVYTVLTDVMFKLIKSWYASVVVVDIRTFTGDGYAETLEYDHLLSILRDNLDT
jgi:hypothetical protein